MDGTAPLELSRLLRAADLAHREAAWEELIEHHTRLIMAVARSFGGDHDAVMERYSYILGKLRESEFRRLRTFNFEAGASFSTWLTVTARRLCLDDHRARFGRQRPEHKSDQATSLRAARRALRDLAESELEPDAIADSSGPAVDAAALRGELDRCLQEALSRLTPTERLLLTLRFEDDLPASRIAGIIGLPSPFHVYRRLNNVLSNLRAALESRGIEGSDG